jgi:hypothetical protein
MTRQSNEQFYPPTPRKHNALPTESFTFAIGVKGIIYCVSFTAAVRNIFKFAIYGTTVNMNTTFFKARNIFQSSSDMAKATNDIPVSY